MRLQIGQQFAEYTIEAIIGAGGMGSVYKARRGPKTYALKVLHELTPESIQRFEREASALAQMESHPGFARIHGFGLTPIPYIVMQLVEGENLAQWSARNFAELSDEQRLNQSLFIMQRVANAVHFLHKQQLCHRDLKPENIIISEGQPIIIDFGLVTSKYFETLTHTGVSLGTPRTMAPEQWQAGKHDANPATDIWAIGVIFYFLYCGRYPFNGQTPHAIANQLNQSNINKICAELPERAAQFVSRALVLNPDHRAQSTEELLSDEVPNQLRKSRWPMFVLALVILSISVGAGLFIHKQQQDTAARQQLGKELRDRLDNFRNNVGDWIQLLAIQQAFPNAQVLTTDDVNALKQQTTEILTKLENPIIKTTLPARKRPLYDKQFYNDLQRWSQSKKADFTPTSRALNSLINDLKNLKPINLKPILQLRQSLTVENLSAYLSNGQFKDAIDSINNLRCLKLRHDLKKQLTCELLRRWFVHSVIKNKSNTTQFLEEFKNFQAPILWAYLELACKTHLSPQTPKTQLIEYYKRLKRAGFGSDLPFPKLTYQTYNRLFNIHSFGALKTGDSYMISVEVQAFCKQQHKRALPNAHPGGKIFAGLFHRTERFINNPDSLILGLRAAIFAIQTDSMAPEFLHILFHDWYVRDKKTPLKNVHNVSLVIPEDFRPAQRCLTLAATYEMVTRLPDEDPNKHKESVKLATTMNKFTSAPENPNYLKAYIIWMNAEIYKRGYRQIRQKSVGAGIWSAHFKSLGWQQESIQQRLVKIYTQSLEMGFRSRHFVFQGLSTLFQFETPKEQVQHLKYLELCHQEHKIFDSRYGAEGESQTAESDPAGVGLNLGLQTISALDALVFYHIRRDWKKATPYMAEVYNSGRKVKVSHMVLEILKRYKDVTADLVIKQLKLGKNPQQSLKELVQEELQKKQR